MGPHSHDHLNHPGLNVIRKICFEMLLVSPRKSYVSYSEECSMLVKK
jgi:hypothetical protein